MAETFAPAAFRSAVMAQQERLDFAPALTVQYPKLRDLLVHVVYGSRKSLNGVAADLDHSPSELSRMLNRQQDDPRKLDVDDFVAILQSTGDMRPLQWLAEKFQRDPERVRAEATAQLAQLVPLVAALLEQSAPPKSSRR